MYILRAYFKLSFIKVIVFEIKLLYYNKYFINFLNEFGKIKKYLEKYFFIKLR